jgi:two-component system nitrogen regulation response regulator GlnG
MGELRQRIEEASHSDHPVLIEGERGTGRERVARLIHELGPRKGRGFVRLDPEEEAARPVDDQLAEAAGGTLLVKDVAHVGRGSQRRLARALPKAQGGREPQVRIVASTGVDLGRAVADELFDAELFERLGQQRILVPALRRRTEDIPLLLEHFAEREARDVGGQQLKFTTAAMDKLCAYSWPGNVAELRDLVRRLCLRRRKVEVGDVERALPPVAERVPVEQLSFEEMVRSKIRALLIQLDGAPVEDLYEEVISRVERPLIELVLERTGHNQIKAAELLGLNRNTLRKKISERKVQLAPSRPDGKKRSPRRK